MACLFYCQQHVFRSIHAQNTCLWIEHAESLLVAVLCHPVDGCCHDGSLSEDLSCDFTFCWAVQHHAGLRAVGILPVREYPKIMPQSQHAPTLLAAMSLWYCGS